MKISQTNSHETEKKLKILISTKKGFAFKSSWYSTKGTCIVKVSDFTEDSIDTSNLTFIPNVIAADYQDWVIREGDVIIQTVGSYPRNPDSVVGKTIRVPAAADGALLNQNAVILIPNSFLLKGFLFYSLKSNKFKEHVYACARGSANQASITLKDIMRFPILLPSIKDQEKCVSILSTCDELLRCSKQIINSLQKTKKGLMQHLLTRGIGHTRFKQTKIGEIPESWKLEILENLVVITDCEHKTAPESDILTEWVSIRSSEIGMGTLDLSECKYISKESYSEWTKRCIPKPGDLVFTREAPVGHIAMVPGIQKIALGQRMVLLSVRNSVSSDYLMYTLLSPTIQSYIERKSVGTTAKRIDVAEIKKLPIPIPPEQEQARISEILDEVANKIKVEKDLRKYAEILKKGLMQVLLTGKMRVNI